MHDDVDAVGRDRETQRIEPPGRIGERRLERSRVGDREALVLELGDPDHHPRDPV